MHEAAEEVSHTREWVSPRLFEVDLYTLSELGALSLIFFFILNLSSMRLDVLVLLFLQASVLIKSPLELNSVEHMSVCLLSKIYAFSFS